MEQNQRLLPLILKQALKKADCRVATYRVQHLVECIGTSKQQNVVLKHLTEHSTTNSLILIAQAPPALIGI